jgi:hypothetical protein
VRRLSWELGVLVGSLFATAAVVLGAALALALAVGRDDLHVTKVPQVQPHPSEWRSWHGGAVAWVYAATEILLFLGIWLVGRRAVHAYQVAER